MPKLPAQAIIDSLPERSHQEAENDTLLKAWDEIERLKAEHCKFAYETGRFAGSIAKENDHLKAWILDAQAKLNRFKYLNDDWVAVRVEALGFVLDGVPRLEGEADSSGNDTTSLSDKSPADPKDP